MFSGKLDLSPNAYYSERGSSFILPLKDTVLKEADKKGTLNNELCIECILNHLHKMVVFSSPQFARNSKRFLIG